MKIREAFEAGATLLVMGAAAVMLGLRMTEEKVIGPMEPEDFRDWEEVNSAGLRIGPGGGTVGITGFLDVECPYCAGAWATVAELLDEFPADVSFALHHFPLDIHPHATLGAVALECSFEQERLRPFLDAVFQWQDSVGTRPWVAFAEDAGITNQN